MPQWQQMAHGLRRAERPARRGALSPAAGAEPLKVGFIYVSPIGDAGLDVSARQRPQGNGKGARRAR